MSNTINKRIVKRSIVKRSIVKRSIVKALIWFEALYGAETWTRRKRGYKKIQSFQMWMWKRRESIGWTDIKHGNTDVSPTARGYMGVKNGQYPIRESNEKYQNYGSHRAIYRSRLQFVINGIHTLNV